MMDKKRPTDVKASEVSDANMRSVLIATVTDLSSFCERSMEVAVYVPSLEGLVSVLPCGAFLLHV
jgi:hypothetical protein